MAQLLNSIGNLNFMALNGSVERPRERLEIDQRPGIDGTEFQKGGVKGVPFTLQSIVDVEDYNDGYVQFANYLAAIPSPSLPMKQLSYDPASFHNFYVKVVDVRLISLRQAPVIVGGLQYTTGAILVCQWDLIGVEFPAP